MPEKGRWISAETFLREVSRREDEYFDGVRDEEIENVSKVTDPLDKKLQAEETPVLNVSQRHSSGYDRFIANDIMERDTGSEPPPPKAKSLV